MTITFEKRKKYNNAAPDNINFASDKKWDTSDTPLFPLLEALLRVALFLSALKSSKTNWEAIYVTWLSCNRRGCVLWKKKKEVKIKNNNSTIVGEGWVKAGWYGLKQKKRCSLITHGAGEDGVCTVSVVRDERRKQEELYKEWLRVWRRKVW